MNGHSERSVNVKASVNGKQLTPESVTGLLEILFSGGWLEDIIKTSLSVPATAMEQVNADLNRQMAAFRERLEQAVNRAEAAAASADAESVESSEESEEGEEA